MPGRKLAQLLNALPFRALTRDKMQVLLVEDSLADARLIKEMLAHDDNISIAVKHVLTLEEGMRSLAPGSENQVILLDLRLSR